MILSGAMPVFIKPDIDIELGIANGVTLFDVRHAGDSEAPGRQSGLRHQSDLFRNDLRTRKNRRHSPTNTT
ncbi:MAG: hypothetical protein MZU97_05315 [Bacillus subtilis]|nr:hypothetical protein [Bacillus subtilis]